MTRKVYIRTFGCQMNEYDSAKMADVLHEAEGLETTERAEDADVILFNTCSVREKAQEKVFSDLGRVKHLKKTRPDLPVFLLTGRQMTGDQQRALANGISGFFRKPFDGPALLGAVGDALQRHGGSNADHR